MTSRYSDCSRPRPHYTWGDRITLAFAMVFVIAAVLAIVFVFLASTAHGRDLGQWDETTPQIRQWFQGLMQPDNPGISCCGEADAYWADSFENDGDQYVAIITDRRDDAPLGRPHINVGTRILIPNNKIKWNAGNPTGHGILFKGASDGSVYCFLPPGGV